MWLFKKKLTKNKTSNNKSFLPAINNSDNKNGLLLSDFAIPPSIFKLIWFCDGPLKNYSPTSVVQKNTINFVTIICEYVLEEPSAISVDNTIMRPCGKQAELPPYFPCYKELTSEQKWQYLKTLEDIYNPNNHIGYIFLFYYGLERHLLEGDFENAFDTILKLREVYSSKSFQDYSFKTLLSICLVHKRDDLFRKLSQQINSNPHNIDVNFYLIYKQLSNSPLTAKEMMNFAKKFGFNNFLYMKRFPVLFEKTLSCLIKNRYVEFYIRNFVSVDELEKYSASIFANISIKATTTIPNIIGSPSLKQAVNSLLNETHVLIKNNLVKPKCIIKENK